MSCNCRSQKQILTLARTYGTPLHTSKTKLISNYFANFFSDTLILLVCIILFPLLFLYITGIALFKKDKKLDIRKIIGLKKLNSQADVRKQ